ncbi:hypothetical protein [Methanobrevibacter sp.]|uniref:hypothetical protein n=1 Tax=Methanobrevibacter sp. TaxID=66852 RepID=UPI0038638C4D
MEFILNNRKYSILNHELYINYLMVDSYFKQFSKYDYDIHFDFLDAILEKEKVEFDDILEGTRELEELIDREEINFLPTGVVIDQNVNEKFKITYQTLEFDDVNVGEAIPLLICLTSLVNARPVVSLYQIDDELQNFLKKFRKYEG